MEEGQDERWLLWKAGGDPSQVSVHSLRVGYCTQAAIAGLQPWQIREQTGYTSDLMLA